MFLTPVIYPVKAVPDTWRWLLWLNPMGGVVEGFRAAILGGPTPWNAIVISAGVSGAIFLVAILYFRRIERQFADII
jgi:lipopolysaccharide transport system permease protein